MILFLIEKHAALGQRTICVLPWLISFCLGAGTASAENYSQFSCFKYLHLFYEDVFEDKSSTGGRLLVSLRQSPALHTHYILLSTFWWCLGAILLPVLKTQDLGVGPWPVPHLPDIWFHPWCNKPSRQMGSVRSKAPFACIHACECSCHKLEEKVP